MIALLELRRTPEERAIARAEEDRRQRERFDRRLTDQVERIEREVRALKLLIGEDGEQPTNAEVPNAR